MTRKIKNVYVLIFVLVIGGLGLFEVIDADANRYKLTAYFDNIGGLLVGADVTIAGVAIGEVTAVRIDQGVYSAYIEMMVDDEVNKLPIDSTAMILTNGLAGERYIGISIGGSPSYFKAGDMFEDTQSALVLEELIGPFLLNRLKQ